VRYNCDVLVIGGGGAAVRAAVEAAGYGVKVLLIDKGRFERSGSSPLALHGLASVLHRDDSEETLISDLMCTGCGINDLDLVHAAVRESRVEPALLEELGVRFIRHTDGSYHIYKGAGHSAPHGLTFDEAGCGITFVAVLGKEAWRRGVQLVDGVMITELLVDDGKVTGALGVGENGEIYTFSAGAVVLAAGGANNIYSNVTPRIAQYMYRTTGDGYAIAFRAGLPLVDMEFANFRDSPPAARMGGRYINARGESFMARYDPLMKEKAPRGKVVEAIYQEMQAGNGPVYIEIDDECEHVVEFLPDEYRAYVRACKEGKRPPVTISFQRLLGGARINPDASCAIRGLYIAGETAGGFNGADRLMGAAFLETQVFGRFAGTGAAEFALAGNRKEPSEGLVKKSRDRVLKILERKEGPRADEILQKIHRLTWDYAGIVREAAGLKKALGEIIILREKLNGAVGRNRFEVMEVQNLALVAEIVVRAALAREETRGTHRRSDFPQLSEEMAQKHISLSRSNEGEIKSAAVPSRG